MMRLLVAISVMTLLVAPAFGQEQPRQDIPRLDPELAALGTINVFLLADSPAKQGRITLVSNLGAATTAEMKGATHINLRIGTRGYVFAIAQLPPEGQPVGNTLVNLNGRTMTLFEAAGLLQASARGQAGVIIFTEGPMASGVVTGITRADVVLSDSPVVLGSATHVTVAGSPRDHEFFVLRSSDRFGNVIVCSGASADDPNCAMTSRGLFDVVVTSSFENELEDDQLKIDLNI